MTFAFEVSTHELNDGREITYSVIPPNNPQVSESTENIVYFLPHARTLNDQLATSLAGLTRDVLNPDATLTLLPNINYRQGSYSMTKADRRKVRQGDLSPIAELDTDLLRHLGDLGLGSPVLIGASFGASRAAKALSLLEAGERVQGAVLLGAPNVVPRNERGPIMLRRYFSSQAKHIKPQAEASQIPQEVLDHEGLGDGQTLKLARKLVVYSFWGNILPANRALNQFFLQETFFRDITQASTANPDTPIIIGTSFDDPVSPHLKFCNFVLSDELPGSVTFKSYPGNHLTHSSPELIAKLAKQL